MPEDLPSTESELYARQLLLEGHGHPLWSPGPSDSLSPEYKRDGTRKGDVGTLSPTGAFLFAFNIFEAGDHAINKDRIPPDFIPAPRDLLRDPDEHYNQFSPKKVIATKHIDIKALSAEGSS